MRGLVLGAVVSGIVGLAMSSAAGATPLSSSKGVTAPNMVDNVRVVCRERCGPYGCREVCYRVPHYQGHYGPPRYGFHGHRGHWRGPHWGHRHHHHHRRHHHHRHHY